jgi:large subunit ribosomal protein L17
VRNLVLHERIETTVAKAKELRPQIERLVTLARKDTLASRRHIAARLGNDMEVSKKLHDVIAPRYKDRPGGYTRISKLGTFQDVKRDKTIIEFV